MVELVYVPLVLLLFQPQGQEELLEGVVVHSQVEVGVVEDLHQEEEEEGEVEYLHIQEEEVEEEEEEGVLQLQVEEEEVEVEAVQQLEGTMFEKLDLTQSLFE